MPLNDEPFEALLAMDDDDFSWDDEKAAANLHKHNVDFFTAALVFADPDRLEDCDLDSSHFEDRFFCIGAVELAVYYVVFSVLSGGRTRIISARRANKREVNAYYLRKASG